MRGAIGFCVVGAIGAFGCSPDGIFVEVRPPAADSATEKVDLYIARPCDECPGAIKPEGFFFGVPGEVFTHDGIEYQAVVEDGAAWFELQGEGILKLVVAVGTDAQGEITGVAVMKNTIDLDAGSRHYLAPLDAAEPLAENKQRDPSLAGVHAWPLQRDTPRIECLAVDAISPEARTFLVVPRTGDFDCDGLFAQEQECAPFAFAGQEIDQNRHCAVVSQRKFPGAPPVCVVGHAFACQDFPDPGDPDPCVEDFHGGEAVCVPSAVCAADLGDLNIPEKHLAIMSGLGAPSVTCTLLGEQDVNGVLTPCPNPAVEFPLHKDMSALTSCSDPPGFIDFRDPSLTADPELLYADGGSGTPLHIDQATIKMESLGGCALQVSWEGVTGDVNQEVVPALVKVFFDVGGDRRAMLLPVHFQFQAGCVDGEPGGSCVLDAQAPDPMYRCGE